MDQCEEWTQIAQRYWKKTGVADKIELRIGDAKELLKDLGADEHFDFAFIDADKASTSEYFLWALKLSRRGTLIIVDNVVRKGALIDSTSTDPDIQGMRRFTRLLGAESRVSATVIQTVGSKGYDGFALALVLADSSLGRND